MFIASFLSGIAVLLWLGLLAYVGYIVIQRSRGQRSKISVTLAVFILVVAGAVSTLSTSVVIIDAGEAGVVFNVFRGTQPGSLGPGLHFVAPYINQIYRYNVREQVYTMTLITLFRTSMVPQMRLSKYKCGVRMRTWLSCSPSNRQPTGQYIGLSHHPFSPKMLLPAGSPASSRG